MKYSLYVSLALFLSCILCSHITAMQRTTHDDIEKAFKTMQDRSDVRDTVLNEFAVASTANHKQLTDTIMMFAQKAAARELSDDEKNQMQKSLAEYEKRQAELFETAKARIQATNK